MLVQENKSVAMLLTLETTQSIGVELENLKNKAKRDRQEVHTNQSYSKLWGCTRHSGALSYMLSVIGTLACWWLAGVFTMLANSV